FAVRVDRCRDKTRLVLLLGGGVEGQLLHLTNPREDRFFSTRPLFHRYQSRLAEVRSVRRWGGPKRDSPGTTAAWPSHERARPNPCLPNSSQRQVGAGSEGTVRSR